LQNWLADELLVSHAATRTEILNLLALAEEDLKQCRLPGLGPEWKLSIAYNAVLRAATAALAAAGYRAPSKEGHHYVVLQSLAFTAGLGEDAVRKLDVLRKKRHNVTYGTTGAVSDREAEDALRLISSVCAGVQAWLQSKHSELVGE
jgi:uncharacterized protein (UPF0332 family)